MKIKRFTVMAIITMLVVGTMGMIASHSFALGLTTAGIQGHASFVPLRAASEKAKTAVQAQLPSGQTQTCAQDQISGTEGTTSADTDNVDLQCGDQNAPDGLVSGSDAAGQDTQTTVDPAGTDNQNVQDQSGDQNAPDSGAQTP